MQHKEERMMKVKLAGVVARRGSIRGKPSFGRGKGRSSS
jgi:hypothetical protein